MTLLHRAGELLRRNAVLAVAVTAALISSLIIPPDIEYLGYFDVKTLSCLFCVLAVVCALRDIHFFSVIAEGIVRCFKNTRMTILILVYITFISSMFIANDMALITFLPLGYFVLSATGMQKHMAFLFIMQNIAANLGGMLTPFGNPQNLYIYSKFNISNTEFVKIMFPPFLLSVAIITVCCLFVKKEPLALACDSRERLNPGLTVLYLLLFALSIAIVFRGIPYYIGLIVIPAVLLFFDRKALLSVDYPLLLTFTAFFIFAGNMARMSLVRSFFAFVLSKSTLLFSILSCQLISNVPTAILLSQFTNDYSHLLVGVNIGGVGTLIASLASLITFREYQKHNPKRVLYYIGMFSLYNFSLLIILTLFMLFIS